MFQKKPSTKICNSLLADKRSGNAAQISLGSEIAQLVGAPDPNHYSSDREYRKALIEWEKMTPRKPAIASANTSNGASFVVCLSCFEVSIYFGQEEDTSRDEHRSTHICE